MEPTIMGNKIGPNGEKIPNTGDRLVVEKISYHFRPPRRGELAVFILENMESDAIKPPCKYSIKRVVGLPGDTISIKPPYIFINGEQLVDPPIFKKISESMDGYSSLGTLSTPADKIKLGSDQYFLLGDNSKNSFDSRFLGAVPQNNFIGRAVRIIWPINRMKILE